MTQKNTLSEWLEQTRRVNKHVDQICMDAIDSIIEIMPHIDKHIILSHRKFFDKICNYYYKDNPADLIIKVKRIEKCKPCDSFVESSIDRCKMAVKMVSEQWFELIDFMWDRPECVNPSLIDEYVRFKVSEACRNNKKKNPLANGMWSKFGRQWKDKKGKWHPERRKRF